MLSAQVRVEPDGTSSTLRHLVHPGQPMPPAAAAVSSITEADLKGALIRHEVLCCLSNTSGHGDGVCARQLCSCALKSQANGGCVISTLGSCMCEPDEGADIDSSVAQCRDDAFLLFLCAQ